MEALVHGIFTLIKLTVLGSIYASLTLLIFRMIGLLKPGGWVNRVSKKKIKLWFFSGAIISIGLFVFATTHWGAHGLGDSARIPLNHGKSIHEINGSQSYITGIDYKYGDLWIESFAKTSDIVVGKIDTRAISNTKTFFAWNLMTNEVEYFDNKNEYEKYAKSKALPLTNSFMEFGQHYSDYWSGWRFWTLL
ncbi:MAG: hypothetical protein VXW38_10675 [Bacteroidota bacterium]|nr:hypothetical protein [Bacteroidota bacterium]